MLEGVGATAETKHDAMVRSSHGLHNDKSSVRVVRGSKTNWVFCKYFSILT